MPISDTIILPAHAKINLFLHVLRQRSDGYHDLQTVFQLLDYGDELQFQLREDTDIDLYCDIPALSNENNLVWRAAQLLQKELPQKKGISISLKKNLPLGGGLGGGSSDAATTLLALNALWECHYSLAELAIFAKTLGADVPLFIYGNSAFGEGIGEILEPLTLPVFYFLVLTPEVEISSSEIFRNKQLTRDTKPCKIAEFFDAEQYFYFGKNDLQSVVFEQYPEVALAANWLEQYAPARMTGSGASVFAAFSSHAEALAVCAKVEAPWQAFVAKGINHSAVHRRLSTLNLFGV